MLWCAPPPPASASDWAGRCSPVPDAPTDELIRQVTVNCAERGLLLLRVRDEIRMTIAAYQTLYESSIAFGMRKAPHCREAGPRSVFLFTQLAV